MWKASSLQKYIYWKAQYEYTYSTQSTKGILLQEKADLGWSRNSKSLQADEIYSIMFTRKKSHGSVANF